MKKQKRDLSMRAYKRGYLAGLKRRSKEDCPSAQEAVRQQWLSGWRDGRNDSWDGYTGVSGIQKVLQVGL